MRLIKVVKDRGLCYADFSHIEESAKGRESEDNFAGLFDDIDVNSNKLGATVAKRNANLVKLIEGVTNMGLSDYKDNSIDAFGDTYEYLMSWKNALVSPFEKTETMLQKLRNIKAENKELLLWTEKIKKKGCGILSFWGL